MAKKYKIAFVFIVERGDLENKALLLGESLRRLFQKKEEVPIFAVRPRKGEEIDESTIDSFRKLGINYVYNPINKRWRNLPFANQVYGPALVEEILADETEVLVYLDADIVCLNMPERLFLKVNEKVLVVPIDVNYTCGVKYGNDFPLNWTFALNFNSVNADNLWPVYTNVDYTKIYPCFNSGLIAVRPEIGIFRKWKEMFEDSINKGYFGLFSPLSKEFSFTDQVFLASVILSLVRKEEIVIMDRLYNCPLNLAEELLKRDKKISLNEVIFLHYHHSFYDFKWKQFVTLDYEHMDWLNSRLPLKKDIKTARYRLKSEVARQYILHYYWKLKKAFK